LLNKRRLLVQRDANNQVIEVLEVDDDKQARQILQMFGQAMLDVTIDVFPPGTPLFARLVGHPGRPVSAVMLEDRSTDDFTYKGVALVNGTVMPATLDPYGARLAYVVFDVVGSKECGTCGAVIVPERRGAERTRIYLVEDDAAEHPVRGAAFLAPEELTVALRCANGDENLLALADGEVDLDAGIPQPPDVLFARVLTVNAEPYRR
jgi:hypothetical protein